MTPSRDALRFAVWLGLAAATWIAQANAQNAGHRRKLLNEAYQHPAALSPRAAELRFIPTNTLAFRHYALDSMLAQVNALNFKWKLGLASPITSDPVTRLAVTAGIQGMQGGITISNRHHFGFKDGSLADYHDRDFCWKDVERDIPRLKQMSAQRSSITVEEASQMASEAIRILGIVPGRLDLIEKPFAEQFHFESEGGRKVSLPLFRVHWKASPDVQLGDIVIEVSGLTKKIVNYENYRTPPLLLPTNYFQMLGISPDRKDWGLQYGYDPMHSAAFDQFARLYAAEQLNRAIRLWQLEPPRAFGTNDITWFLAKPHTNAPDISASFSNRFYLQIAGGRIGLFEDRANNRSAFAESSAKLNDPVLMTNTLDDRTIIDIARRAIHQLGLRETQLGLAEPPKVKQCELPGRQPGQTIQLPLYDVLWAFPPTEQPRFGESSAIGVQIPAISRQVTMFANNCPWTPAFSLPTNYLQILGPGTSPKPIPKTLPRKPRQ